MKCPICGSYNKPEYAKCYICGAVLDGQKPKSPPADHTTDLWTKGDTIDHNNEDVPNRTDRAERRHRHVDKPRQEIQFGDIHLVKPDPHEEDVPEPIVHDAPEEAATGRRQRSLQWRTKKLMRTQRGIWDDDKKSRSNYTNRKRSDVPIIALDDETQKPEQSKEEQPSRRRRTSQSANAIKIERFQEGQEVNVIIPEEKFEDEPQPIFRRPQKKLRKLKVGRLIIVCTLAAAIIFGGVIGMYYLIRGISSGFSQLFVPRDQLPNDGKPLVERVLKDGREWHRITFYGEDGDRVLVEDESHGLKRTLTVHDGKAELMLDDYSYMPDAEEEPFAYVDLKASHFDKEGLETILNVPVYRISVPLAPLQVLYPLGQDTEVDAEQALVRVKVADESRVIIDGKNMTGNVDNEGYTKTYVNLEPGINDVKIIVELDAHRKNTYIQRIVTPERNVQFSYKDLSSEHRNNKVTLEGVTEPGATVEVLEGWLADDYVDVKPEGGFNFRIQLNDFGWNTIRVRVTTEDNRTAEITHNINRIPLEGAYTSSAWPLEYEALMANANGMTRRIFLLPGTMMERIDTPEARLYKYNVGTEENPQPVIITYEGLYDLEIGKNYTAYADVLGKYDNIPWLYARYIYVDDTDEDDDE